MMFRADTIVRDGDTEDLHAEGHVYFYSFTRNEKLWCDKLDYHTEKGNEHGKFYNVVGETMPKIVAHPKQGILYAPTAPHHFEGDWAERGGDRYVVHDGWVTNCSLPETLVAPTRPKFDIIPAIAPRPTTANSKSTRFRSSSFLVLPLAEARAAGGLLPAAILRGFYIGAGYYWAINRSYDLTYEAQVFTSGISWPTTPNSAASRLGNQLRPGSVRVGQQSTARFARWVHGLWRGAIESWSRLDGGRHAQLHHHAPLPPAVVAVL